MGATVRNSSPLPLYTPCTSLPVIVTDFTRFAATSSRNCENEGCASGRERVWRTTVHNNTTTMMMTTQKTAVLTLEFIPSPTYRQYTAVPVQPGAPSPAI